MFNKAKIFYAYFDEPDAAKVAADAATKAAADAAAAATGGGDPNKVFTQAELNSIVATERKKNDEKTKTLVADLERIKTGKSLSDSEKTTLQSKIDELNNTLLTKEELTAKEKKSLETQHRTALDAEVKEKEAWKNRFVTSTILGTISDAANEAKAFNSHQITALLQPITALKEATDAEGNPTGRYVPRVAYPDTDKEGKQVTLDLTVPEAVKRMRETPEKFGNLFKDTAAGGTGTLPGDKLGVDVDITKMTIDQYMEYRKKVGLARKPGPKISH